MKVYVVEIHTNEWDVIGVAISPLHGLHLAAAHVRARYNISPELQPAELRRLEGYREPLWSSRISFIDIHITEHDLDCEPAPTPEQQRAQPVAFYRQWLKD